jgi:hypothetical protein
MSFTQEAVAGRSLQKWFSPFAQTPLGKQWKECLSALLVASWPLLISFDSMGFGH